MPSGARSTVTLPSSPTSEARRAMTGSIKCPECRAEIPLTEVISHQIEEQLAAEFSVDRNEVEREIDTLLAALAAEDLVT